MRLSLTPLLVLLLCTCVRAQHTSSAEGGPLRSARDSLREILRTTPDTTARLAALWELEDIYRTNLNRYDSSFLLAREMYDLARRAGRKDWQFRALQSLGWSQQRSGNRPAAIGYFRQAAALARGLGEGEPEVLALIGLASAFSLDGSISPIDSARRAMRRAYAIVTSDSTTRARQGWYVISTLAQTYAGRSPRRAAAYYREALLAAPTEQNKQHVLYQLLEIAFDARDYPEVITLVRRINSLNRGERVRGYVNYYLGVAYRETGNTDSVFHYMNAYASALHANADRRRETAVADAEARFQTREKQAEIDRLALEDEVSKLQIARQRSALLAGLVLLVLLGGFTYFLLVQRRRITRQNATIRRTLGEKEILLREIHHRVKNNLQMISSLLSLQGDYIEDAAALDAIEMGQQRVRSMAIIHQRLYLRDEVTTAVSARDYLDQLIRELMGTLNVAGKALSLKKYLEDIELDIDRMIPLGLIANELITNALKYAFRGREAGAFTVRFERVGPGIRLLIADDGTGGEFTLDKPGSFGHLLIRSFTEQLEGTLLVDSTDGTRVELVFPAEATE